MNEYPGVKNLIYRLLFRGENIGYNPDDSGIDMAEMFGFIKFEMEMSILQTAFLKHVFTICFLCQQMNRKRMYIEKGQD